MVYYTTSPQETEQLAERFAAVLEAGCFIAFYGDLGAGKTAFMRGLARGLGCGGEQVSSPTFSLMHAYQGGRLPLYHFDLYRIEGGEIERLGFDEIFFDPSCVSAVEWAERLEPADLPPRRIEISIRRLDGDNRSIVFTPVGMQRAAF